MHAVEGDEAYEPTVAGRVARAGERAATLVAGWTWQVQAAALLALAVSMITLTGLVIAIEQLTSVPNPDAAYVGGILAGFGSSVGNPGVPLLLVACVVLRVAVAPTDVAPAMVAGLALVAAWLRVLLFVALAAALLFAVGYLVQLTDAYGGAAWHVVSAIGLGIGEASGAAAGLVMVRRTPTSAT